MAALPTEITAIIPNVSSEISGGILGRDAPGSTRATALATVALRLCYDYAPAAPIEVMEEAAVRLSGWMWGRAPHVTGQRVKDPSGTEIDLMFRAAGTANGLRESGASFMLSSYRTRHARPIG